MRTFLSALVLLVLLATAPQAGAGSAEINRLHGLFQDSESAVSEDTVWAYDDSASQTEGFTLGDGLSTTGTTINQDIAELPIVGTFASGDKFPCLETGVGLRKCDYDDLPTGGGGSGDVTAAANLGDNLLIRGDGAVKGVQNTGITIDDTDNITGVATVTATNVVASTTMTLPSDGAFDPAVTNGAIGFDEGMTGLTTGLLKLYGLEQQGLVSMPIAEFTGLTNGAVPTYNSTNDEFELAVPSGSGDVTAAANLGDNLLVRGDGSGKGVQNSGITLSDTDAISGATLDVDSNTFLNAGSLDMAKIGTPQYSTMKWIQATTHSSGLVDGGGISNNGDGTVTVAAGDGLVRASDSNFVTLYSTEWVENSSVTLTDNSINYIYMSFTTTSTDPTVAVSTSEPTDNNTNILLGSVYRAGIELHITTPGSYKITNHIGNIIKRMKDTEYFNHATGGALSATGTRNIATTAGVFWEGLNQINTISQDTSGTTPNNHTFEYFYYNGTAWITHEEAVSAVTFTGAGLDDATSGGTFLGSHTQNIHVEIDATGTPDTFKWSYKDNDGTTNIEVSGVAITGAAQALIDGTTITFAATTGHTLADYWEFDGTLSSQIDNTQYNNVATGLATLGNNKYGVHWVYLDVHGHVAVLFGQGNYSLSQAEDAQPPSTSPEEFETHTRLIGRILIQKSSTTFTTIENNYGDTFQGSVPTDHGDLSGLTDDDHTQYSLISSQAGVPISTPSRVGEVNIDTTNDRVYVSTDTASSADWDLLPVTGAQIKALYEAETNAYTDTKDTKLSGIETLADVTDATNVAAATTLTGDVTSAGFATTIANKSVHVAMLDDGVDGELITWSATGVATTVSVGTANQVLTSNGLGAPPTFEDAAGGGIGGSTGGTDNAVQRADGVGGSTLQSSSVIIDDSNNISGLGTIDNTGQLYTLGNIRVDGQADTIQLRVRANGTNTNDVLVVENSGGVDHLSVDNSGNITVANNIVVGGTVDGIDVATDVSANTAKTSNATHTGDVTGATALTIAAGAVDVPMLANGTDGELITWSATGVPATVAVGTATHVLTSNGIGVAPTFQAAAGGGGGDLWTDPIDGNITVDTDDSYKIGVDGARLKEVWSHGFNSEQGAGNFDGFLFQTDSPTLVTGMQSETQQDIKFRTAGSLALVLNNGQKATLYQDATFNKDITVGGTGVIDVPAGSISLPSYSFTGSTNTGIYRNGTNKVGIVANGTESMYFASTRVTVNDDSNDIEFQVKSNNGVLTLAGEINSNVIKTRHTRPKLEFSASKTLALSEAGTFLRNTSTSTQTVTLPTNAAVAFANGTEFELYAENGAITITADTGVLLNDVSAGSFTLAKYDRCILRRIETGQWVVQVFSAPTVT